MELYSDAIIILYNHNNNIVAKILSSFINHPTKNGEAKGVA